MTENMFFRSYIERCLQDAWEVRYVVPDPDGDYPFACGTAIGYVRVGQAIPDTAQIFAVAVEDVQGSPELLAEIDALNAASLSTRFALTGQQVMVFQNLPAVYCTPQTLGRACQEIANAATNIGVMIATVHGGALPYPPGAADQIG